MAPPPLADVVVFRQTPYVSGTADNDSIRITLIDDYVQLVRNGVDTTVPARHDRRRAGQ